MCSSKDENWRKQNETISSRLKYILHQDKFTDACIVVQGKEFRCHRLILALGSPYFERTFYHTFRHDGTSSPVVISDVSPTAFQTVQTFLYAGRVTFGNEKQAYQTFEAAEKFQMSDLKSECEIYLSDLDFSPLNIWDNFNEAIRLKMEKFRFKCLTFVQKNAKESLKNSEFFSASKEAVLDIVKADKLAISESELLDLVIGWAALKMRKNDSLKEFLLPYLKHIRFNSMTAKEFCDIIKVHQTIINSDDCVGILQYLKLPYKNSLPYWCSTLSRGMWS